MEQQRIDSLLERYLSLVDEYSRLREELTELQTGVYQNIARANFTGERGMRYGQDHYDERMRALRVLDIELAEGNVPVFTMKTLDTPVDGAVGDDGKKSQEEAEKRNDSKEEETEEEEEETADVTNAQQNANSTEEQRSGQEKKDQKAKKPNHNPLRWFGILAPQPLRAAQAQSIQAVQEAIPRLVSVNAEMEHVEIEIRRAKKKRAKAMAAMAAEREVVRQGAVEAR